MPTGKNKSPSTTPRVSVISAVKTYLGFFVLLTLVVEASLGALALNSGGSIQLLAVSGMLLVILLLIGVVSLFAYKKPEALLRSMASHDAAAASSFDATPAGIFCSELAGCWWEAIKPDDASALSLVSVSPDPAGSGLKFSGKAYDRQGNLNAVWETVASCVNPGEKKVFYYWRGWHPARPNEPFEGFGELVFHASDSGIHSGMGFFSDTNLTQLNSTTRKTVQLHRSSAEEATLLQQSNARLVAERIRQKLEELG